ncbi:MAG TPA: Nramp family divalent metal transporter [Thermomicrobiales bacterium]|nr:Nramp family divalent metal transporter [Thermomicrobiales bacterium]
MVKSEPIASQGRRYAGEVIGSGGDSGTLSTATAVLQGTSKKGRLARLLPFLGPAFIACIAYVDPGNFATNIQGGAQFGYLLVWVIVASNLMAMLIQALSAKLGIATGRNLPEIIRERFPRPVVYVLWALAEVVAMATDLAEFLGAAVGFNLLFGIPLLPAGILTGLTTFIILSLQRFGFRPLEAIITGFVGIIALCYLAETILGKPDFGATASAIIHPQFAGTESILLASGILGATVMPHVIYLHSALTQDRVVARDSAQARRLFRFELVDVVIAMSVAGLVNAAMLLMAAETFWAKGIDVTAANDIIFEAHRTLAPILGGASSTIFAISLLASGLSSSTVGTMAGQVIMQGFLKWHIPIWVRRLITMAPALLVIALGVDATRTLVISQVVLSFGIPFALIPLVLFTRNRALMGDLVNHRVTTAIATAVVALIVALNIFLLHQTFFG